MGPSKSWIALFDQKWQKMIKGFTLSAPKFVWWGTLSTLYGGCPTYPHVIWGHSIHLNHILIFPSTVHFYTFPICLGFFSFSLKLFWPNNNWSSKNFQKLNFKTPFFFEKFGSFKKCFKIFATFQKKNSKVAFFKFFGWLGWIECAPLPFNKMWIGWIKWR